MVPESGFVIDLDGLESDYDLQQMVGREEPEGKEGVTACPVAEIGPMYHGAILE